MNQPNDVDRLREIKHLLDRIQRLPRLAALPGNAAAAEINAGADDAPIVSYAGGPPHPGMPGEQLELARVSEADPVPHDAIPPPLPLPRRDSSQVAFWESKSRALVPARQGGSSGIGPWVFVLATVVNTFVAAVLAVVITLGVTRREVPPPVVEAEKVIMPIKPVAEVPVEPPQPRPFELLPVGSPAEPLRLEAMKPAPLPLQARPEEALQESYILMLSGLPANASLLGGMRIGGDTWVLAPGALQRLEIVLPEWSAAVIEVGVELRRTNGAVAAQSKIWLAVPPPPSPGAQLDEAAIKDLVRNGDRLLSRGDVAAARAIYERAAAMGSAQAALAMGTTYDPQRLWSLGVFGMVGSKERARQWYQRAAELGHPEAKTRIAALQKR